MDEVHRFAIGFHRQQRKKANISTTLTSIEGIGETRARSLLRYFKTISAIREASVEELAGAPGMNYPAAQKVYDHFRKKEE